MNKKPSEKHIDEIPLDDYEKELEEFLERGEFVRAKNFNANKKMFQDAAKNFLELQKTKQVTLRLKNEDLLKVKAKAKRSGIPYQRLLKALIHKYAEGETSVNI